MRRKECKAEDLPPFPNEFWEHVLRIRDEQHERYKLFSPGLRRSAEVYQEQRDRALAMPLEKAA
jgi:hypothetical protein